MAIQLAQKASLARQLRKPGSEAVEKLRLPKAAIKTVTKFIQVGLKMTIVKSMESTGAYLLWH